MGGSDLFGPRAYRVVFQYGGKITWTVELSATSGHDAVRIGKELARSASIDVEGHIARASIVGVV